MVAESIRKMPQKEEDCELRDDVTVITSNEKQGEPEARSIINEAVESLSGKIWNDDLNRVINKDPMQMSEKEIEAVKTKFRTLKGLREDLLSVSESLQSKIGKLGRTVQEATGEVCEEPAKKCSKSKESSSNTITLLRRSLELSKAELTAQKCQSEVEIGYLQEEIVKCNNVISSLEKQLSEKQSFTPPANELTISEEIREGLMVENAAYQEKIQELELIRIDFELMKEGNQDVQDKNKQLQDKVNAFTSELQSRAELQKQLELELRETRESEQDLLRNSLLTEGRANNFASLEKHNEELVNENSQLKNTIQKINQNITVNMVEKNIYLETKKKNEKLRGDFNLLTLNIENERKKVTELEQTINKMGENQDTLFESNLSLQQYDSQKDAKIKSLMDENEILKKKIAPLEEKCEISEVKLKKAQQDLEKEKKNVALYQFELRESKENLKEFSESAKVHESDKQDLIAMNVKSEMEVIELKHKVEVLNDLKARIKEERLDMNQRESKLKNDLQQLAFEKDDQIRKMELMLNDVKSKGFSDLDESKFQTQNLESQLSSANAKLLKLEETNRVLEHRLSLLDENRSIAEEKKIELLGEIEKLKVKSLEKDQRLSLAQMKMNDIKLLKEKLDVENNNLRSDIDRLENIAKGKLDEKGNQEKEIQKLEATIVEIEYANKKYLNQIKDLKELSNERENENKVMDKRLLDAEIRFEKSNEQNCTLIENLEAQLANTNNEIAGLTEMNKELERKINILEIEKANSISEHRNLLHEMEVMNGSDRTLLEELETVKLLLRGKEKEMDVLNGNYKSALDENMKLEHELLAKSKAIENEGNEKGKLERDYIMKIQEVEKEKKNLANELEHLKTYKHEVEVFDNDHKREIAHLQQQNRELLERVNEDRAQLLDKIEMIEELQNYGIGSHSYSSEIIETDETCADEESDSDLEEVFKEISFLRKGFKIEAMEFIPLLHSHFAKVKIEKKKSSCKLKYLEQKCKKLGISLANKNEVIENLRISLKESNNTAYQQELAVNKMELNLIEANNEVLAHIKAEKKQENLIKHLNNEIQTLESSCNLLNCEQLMAFSEINQLKEEKALCEENVTWLQTKLNKCMSEIRQLHESGNKKSSQLAISQNEMKEIKIVSDTKLQKMESTIKLQSSRVTEMEEELQTTRRKLQIVEEAESSLKLRSLFTEQWCKSVEKEIQLLGKEKAELRGKLYSKQKEVFNLEEKIQMKDAESEVSQKLYKSSFNTFKHEVDNLKEELNALDFRLREEKEGKSRNALEKESLLKEMNKIKAQQQDTEKALSLRNIEVLNSVELLKHKTKELQISKTKLSEYEKNLIETQAQLDHLNESTKDRIQHYEFEKQSLENKLGSTQKDLALYKEKFSIVEQDSSKILSKFVAAQAQVNELVEKLHKTEQNLVSTNNLLVTSQDKLTLVENVKKHLELSLSSSVNDNLDTQQKLDASNQEKEQSLKKVKELEKILLEYKGKVSDLEAQLQEVNEKHQYTLLQSSMLGSKSKDMEQMLISSRLESTKLKERCDDLQESYLGYERKVTELNSTLATMQEKIVLLNFDKKESDRKLDELNAKYIDSLATVSELQKKNEDLQNNLTRNEREMNELERQVQEIGVKHMDSLSQNSLLASRINELEELEIKHKHDRRKFEDDASMLQEALTKIKGLEDSMKALSEEKKTNMLHVSILETKSADLQEMLNSSNREIIKEREQLINLQEKYTNTKSYVEELCEELENVKLGKKLIDEKLETIQEESICLKTELQQSQERVIYLEEQVQESNTENESSVKELQTKLTDMLLSLNSKSKCRNEKGSHNLQNASFDL